MTATRPNRPLADAMREAGISNKGLAARVADLARRDDHNISPDHVSVRRWLDGVTPQARTQRYIAAALSARLGRRIEPTDLGFSQGGATEGLPDAAYPSRPETSVDLLARLSGADLEDDPIVARSSWSKNATSGIVTGFLFDQSADPSSNQSLQRAVGSADIIRATSSHLMDLDFRFGGGHVRRLLLFYFRTEVVPLLRKDHPDSTRQEIFRAAAEVAELLGWSAYDAGRFGAAQRYYASGLRLAREANDDLLGGWMLSSLSHQANYLGRYNEAVQLARAAFNVTRGKGSDTVSCLSLAMEARALANLGDAQGCSRTIHKAENLFESRNANDDPPWIAFFNAEELAGEAAHCFRDLGRAPETQTFSVLALDPQNTPPRTQAFIGMVNAAGALNGGDLDQALSTAAETLDLAASLESRRYLRYLSDFIRTLDRYADNPRVIEFTDDAFRRHPEVAPHKRPQ
jgi:tetratricopeptide (TPR) repeat protein